jgi:hypothetical protein
MSFKRLDQEDIVISADSVTAPAWTNNAVQLTNFYTSSAQAGTTSGGYYLNVYHQNPVTSSAAIQFSLAYGHVNGLGSSPLNSGVPENSPTKIIYGQYRTLVNGTEEENIGFGGFTPDDIFVISVERARFKEKLLPGSLSLTLGTSTGKVTLTDNSRYITSETFTDVGRVYQLISGSLGVKNTSKDSDGYTTNKASGSYGALLPDAGLLLLNGSALKGSLAAGGIAIQTGSSKLYNALESGDNFILRSEETVSSNYVFIRARNSEFNYSSNPSNITGSGELRHSAMIDSPQSYVTAVGLYNDNNDLLAVAKLSRPLLKDFTKEALIRIKLDY